MTWNNENLAKRTEGIGKKYFDGTDTRWQVSMLADLLVYCEVHGIDFDDLLLQATKSHMEN